MQWHETYRLTGFKAFLSKEEDAERHLLHECGHVWVGERHGAEVVNFNLNPGGVSDVQLRGLMDLQHHYDVGIAGLLAEAKGILPPWSRDHLLDVGRMRHLADLIHREVMAHSGDQDHALYPDVPLLSRIPSTNWGELSVSDLTRPILEGLSLDRILDALTAISQRFNDPAEWGAFLASVNARRR